MKRNPGSATLARGEDRNGSNHHSPGRNPVLLDQEHSYVVMTRNGSLAEQPQKQRKDQADENHRRDRKIKLELGSVDHDIAGQPSEGHLAQPRPE